MIRLIKCYRVTFYVTTRKISYREGLPCNSFSPNNRYVILPVNYHIELVGVQYVLHATTLHPPPQPPHPPSSFQWLASLIIGSKLKHKANECVLTGRNFVLDSVSEMQLYFLKYFYLLSPDVRDTHRNSITMKFNLSCLGWRYNIQLIFTGMKIRTSYFEMSNNTDIWTRCYR
jgi:hypothetical protein